MGNIKNYKHNKLEIFLSNHDYWDFTLAIGDENGGRLGNYDVSTGDCLVSLFDFNNNAIFYTGNTSANTISSLIYWTGATNSGYTFETIGLTGIDNGLVPYTKDPLDTLNLGLLSALTGNTLIIPANDKRLHLSKVSGSTGNFEYPIYITGDNRTNYANFCGGFYQGYYKIQGSTYQVLPTRVNKGWVAEFWLKKDNSLCSGNTGTTLNDLYPNNKGFFFYMGTRAENKFWNRFEGADTGCTSGCTVDSGCTDTLSEYCTIPKETDIFIGNSGETITLYPSQTITQLISNPFLIYGRASSSGTTKCSVCGGYSSGLGQKNSCNWDGTPIKVTRPKTIKTNNTNPFLIFGRASLSGNTKCSACGNTVSGFGNQTACSFSGFEQSIQFENKNFNIDVYENALGFRIKDDGSIGYRALVITGTCSGQTYISGYTVQESYSQSGLISENEWTSVIIRYTTNYLSDCDLSFKPKRKGRLMFYINGKLKYIVENFDEFIAKALDEHMLKQVGVPFNMSLGGGSQGLLETQTFDGRDLDDLGLPIESNFAGTFIGGISQFKFNVCDLNFNNILNIYSNEVIRYYPVDINIGLEEGGMILQEDGFSLEIE